MVLVVVPLFWVIVQFPLVGRPLSTTDPVDTDEVGCVIVPIVGAVGVGGCALMVILVDRGEVQVAALVTLKV